MSGYIASAQLTAPQVEVDNITKTGLTAVVVPPSVTGVTGIEVKIEGPGVNTTTFNLRGTNTFLSFPFSSLQPGSTYKISARSLGCSTPSGCLTTSPWTEKYGTTLVDVPPTATLVSTNNCPQYVGLSWTYPQTGGPVTNIIVRKSYGGPWYSATESLPPYETSYYDLDAQPGIPTTYVVYTQNALGETTPSNLVSVNVMPYSAPAAPLNLHASHKTNNSISIAWNNAEEDQICRSNIRESYTVVMKRAWESEYKVLGVIYPYSTGFDITGLEENETVEIGVFSWSDQGIQGDWALLTEKTHGKATIPTRVIGVGYKDKFDNWALGISWDHDGEDADYYYIDYSLDEGKTWIELAFVKTGQNVIQHVNLSEGQKYTYRVKAGNYMYGQSEYAYMDGTVSVDYSAVPNAPYGLVAKWSGNDVVLTWVDDSNKEEKYIIERSYKADSDFEEIGEAGRNITTYTDVIGSDSASAFYYRVKAENPLGASETTKIVKISKAATSSTSAVVVYPNPTVDKLSVSVPSHLKASEVEVNVYNQLNQRVFTKSYKAGADIEVSLRKYIPGTYNVVVTSGDFKETRKVVKN
ncbi:MAG: T9SS type A sorting domain-containing protein [Leadbetterella sp.]|nr:T9SS type A sorting domain-containing protein [Leadbetterella sp.]